MKPLVKTLIRLIFLAISTVIAFIILVAAYFFLSGRVYLYYFSDGNING